MRVEINRALAPIQTAYDVFLNESNEFEKVVRTAPPEPEGFSCGRRCGLSSESADKVCYRLVVRWLYA